MFLRDGIQTRYQGAQNGALRGMEQDPRGKGCWNHLGKRDKGSREWALPVHACDRSDGRKQKTCCEKLHPLATCGECPHAIVTACTDPVMLSVDAETTAPLWNTRERTWRFGRNTEEDSRWNLVH